MNDAVRITSCFGDAKVLSILLVFNFSKTLYYILHSFNCCGINIHGEISMLKELKDTTFTSTK
jgi:hypothetical protein